LKTESVKNPRETVKENLSRLAAFYGIDFRRFIFAERVSKSAHLERQFAADLFVDNFVYSAHSTATDALRGGLPVLTFYGESFPNRVGYSLYQSFSVDNENGNGSQMNTRRWTEDNNLEKYLVVDSFKEFEDKAIDLVKPFALGERFSYRKIDWIKLRLLRFISEKRGLFDAENHVHQMKRATQAMMEGYQMNLNDLSLYHLFIARKLFIA
jgi:hypothetical protein